MTHRCTLHVTVADPGDLAAVIEAIEGLGAVVECPAYDERERRRSRDDFLVQALELMSGTPWRKCCQLEAEISTFESVVWPRWRDHEAPPEGSSALRSLLFRGRRLGPLPTTARQLWNIAMKRSAPGNFREKPVQSPPDPE